MKFETVIIGGGRAGCTLGKLLLQGGRSCIIVSEGLSPESADARREYLSLGGLMLPGDSVIEGTREGARVKSVRTRNLGSTPLEADFFVLATGKFFSRGLIATMDSIYEPVFGCDVLYDPDRSKWCDPDFYAPQPFESFGVKCSEDLRCYIGGELQQNLYAAGEILEGSRDITLTAQKIAEEICRRKI